MLTFVFMKEKSCSMDWSKSFMFAIHQTHFLVEKHLEQKLAKAGGITFPQFLILLPLHCTPKMSQIDVAEFLYLTEATVSRHIKFLEHEKLLTRKENPNNRRRHILEMSAKGKRAFEHAHRIIEKELHLLFAGISTEERKYTSQAFEKILTQLLPYNKPH